MIFLFLKYHLSCPGRVTHLNVVVPVVVEVDDSVELGVQVDLDVLGVLEPLAEALARVLLHLDVVKLPEKERTMMKSVVNFCKTEKDK